jgi:hypothetical protein
MLRWLGIGFLSLLSCVAAAAGAAEASLPMIDPLMGISFDPDRVHFDVLDKSEDEIKLLGKRDKWIFAAARDTGGAAILVVAGFHDRESAAENSVECDFGTVLKLDAAGLHMLGASDYLFGKDAPVGAKVVDALMRDASVRYTRAFGGAAAFNRVIATQALRRELVPAPLLPHLAEQGVKFAASATR